MPAIGKHLNKWRTGMTKVGEVYKCETCGNVVEVKKAGDGELVCCGEPMKKQQVKS
jgi:superoxide reductase